MVENYRRQHCQFTHA